MQAQETPEGYQLEQVLIMSRHNLRAPLANNGSVLEQSTPKQWPEWEVHPLLGQPLAHVVPHVNLQHATFGGELTARHFPFRPLLWRASGWPSRGW